MRSPSTPLVVICCVAALLLAGGPIDACTAFLLKHPQGPFMAKNFDWDVSDGMLVINPRGLAKTALVGDGAKPARWTSRYGSVSFNQYGREFPIGGMNETGLAVEVLWLSGTEYPAPGDRRSIGALQWVQYCLDSFRTVGDVVAAASELAITSAAPLHFLACDPSSNCAVIEFLEGKLVVRSERTLPLPVLTNDTYNESLTYLNRTLGYGGSPVKPEGTGSLARFARAANGTFRARTQGGDRPVDDAFAILADVAQPGSTQWSIVYELQKGRVHFRSSANRETRTVDRSALDLDCTAEPRVADLMAAGSGDITASLGQYDPAANRKLVEAGFSAKKVDAPSPEAIADIASYPDGLVCTFETSPD